MTRMVSGIAPFFIVADVPETLSFYRDMLGFEVTFRGRDGATIMFKALGAIRDGKEVQVEVIPHHGSASSHW